MGEVTHFLGIKFTWTRLPDKHLSVYPTQQAFITNLIDIAGLISTNTATTSYRSGHPVDTIPISHKYYIPPPTLKTTMQHLVGSLLWLSNTTRTDLATITSLLCQYTSNPI